MHLNEARLLLLGLRGLFDGDLAPRWLMDVVGVALVAPFYGLLLAELGGLRRLALRLSQRLGRLG